MIGPQRAGFFLAHARAHSLGALPVGTRLKRQISDENTLETAHKTRLSFDF